MTNTIKCVILDDELLAIRFLKLLCDEIEGVEVIKAFNRPDLFLQEIASIDCDLCILDIDMPVMNGLQVAEKIPDKPIIFTTAYPEYAADAFDLNVVDYVRKPLKKERLQQAFEKAKTHLTSPKKRFFEWNTGLGKTKIASDTLLYVRTSEIDSRDKIALLKDQSEITLKNINFKTLLTLLKDKNFVQINKKEAISVSIVNAFSDSEIVTKLSNNEDSVIKLSLSDAYRDAFEEAFK